MTRLTEAEQLKLGGDIQRRLGIKTSRNEPLERFTTMRVGGPADLFAEVRNLFELRGIVRFARQRDLPLFLIGRGSDLVISDAGIGGLVVLVRAAGVRTEGECIVAEAGVQMAKLATVGKNAGLTGLEFGLAIPGTVGGAVWANAGAHGSDVRGVLASALVVGPEGDEGALDPDGLGMAYRETTLKHGPPGRPHVVLEATFALEPAEPDTIAERLASIRRWRQEHQPVGQKSAGSVFRNPEGDSAGRIIDELGLKGRRVGGAQVSPKHANFIVNTGGASAADVRELGGLVRETVRRERGLELAYEIEFVGDWPAAEEGT
ncbi:MAG: UDP-N-acetylmuramate dehydrogenase [Candidatus Limnocylindrales bacterium]